MGLTYFDCNAMLGQWKHNQGECYPDADALIKAMDGYGIDKSLVYSPLSKYYDAREGNLRLLELIDKNPRFIPCATAIPHHTGEFFNIDEFAVYITNNNIAAVRIFPEFHGVKLHLYIWGGLFKTLEALGIPLFIDFTVSTWSDPVDYKSVHDILCAYPDLNVVLLRMSLMSDRYIYPLLERFNHLYIETSFYIGNNALHAFTKRFGADRLLFGTNLPVSSPYAPMAVIETGDLSETQKQMIAAGNLERLLARKRNTDNVG